MIKTGNGEPVPITPDLVAKAGVTHQTLINWLKKYQVNGRPIGIKVGGQWRIWPDQLEKFLQGQGLPL